MPLGGGLPTTQARDLTIQRREGDLVVGTFGRGAFILDDYAALRDVTPQTLAEEARLFPLRDAYMFDELPQVQAAWGNTATPNPPYGALLTYSVGQRPAAGVTLVLSITDSSGRTVRRMDLPGDVGLRRVAWNLRADPPPAAGDAAGREGRGGGAGVEPQLAAAVSGRGGPVQGPPVQPGRYRATIAKEVGGTVTPIGQAQTFAVVPLPR